jgi:hypothetical protein
MIEKVSIDMDSIDGPQGQPITVAHLVLKGDFTKEFEKYLRDTNKDTVALGIGQWEASELYYELERILRVE